MFAILSTNLSKRNEILCYKPHTRTGTTLHQTVENSQDEENLQLSSPINKYNCFSVSYKRFTKARISLNLSITLNSISHTTLTYFNANDNAVLNTVLGHIA